MIYHSTYLQAQDIDNGIVELKFCSPQSVNKLNLATLTELNQALTAIEHYTKLNGLLLTSDKKDFIVGADITEFLTLFSQPKAQLDTWLQFAHDLFNQLEDLPVPTIAVISGFTLGGGCECVLACDFRIGDTSTSIGLPETQLGIMPGFGGCVRLPRLIGADNAIKLITQANPYSAYEALQIGLLDAVVTDSLKDSALAMLKLAREGKLDWQTKRQQKIAPLLLSKPETTLCFTQAKARWQKKTSHYPAPLAAINAIATAANSSRTHALLIERQVFLPLAQSTSARGLIRTFLNQQEYKKHIKLTARKLTHCAVFESNSLALNLIYQAINQKVQVYLFSAQPNAISQVYDFFINHTPQKPPLLAEIKKYLHLITANTSFATPPLDLLINCQELNEQSLIPAAINLTPNTIIINTAQQNQTTNPSDTCCELHWLPQLTKFKLVEILYDEKTAQTQLNSTFNYLSQLANIPILVKKGIGSFFSHLLVAYFFGVFSLLKEGVSSSNIDHCIEQDFGWSLVPTHLLELIGLDKLNEMRTNLGLHHTEFHSIAPFSFSTTTTSTLHYDSQTLIDRLMLPMLNQALIFAYQDRISIQEIDYAIIEGLGFPAFHGGLFHYLDEVGAHSYLERLSHYSHLGDLYQLPIEVQAFITTKSPFYSSTCPPTRGEL